MEQEAYRKTYRQENCLMQSLLFYFSYIQLLLFHIYITTGFSISGQNQEERQNNYPQVIQVPKQKNPMVRMQLFYIFSILFCTLY